MSDHIDGPRQTADPVSDLTDLFAFTSPANSKRTVLIACVLPFAGESALFSNTINYAFVVRRLKQTGLGLQAGFEALANEWRFTFQFEVLGPETVTGRARQAGHCVLPSGATLALTVNDEQGFATADGRTRVFAGLRSDPFFPGWLPGSMKSVPNYLENDNVLSVVVEFDTDSTLAPQHGSLYGVIAETTARHPNPNANVIPRFDWVGRPEQTNFIMDHVPGAVDIRDLWNQETPFALNAARLPLYRQRLTESFQLWDQKDQNIEWDPASLQAHVNVRLNDFLTFDVAKPMSDKSHLEIEKSTLEGRPYTTGGGRTVNANVIDILVTWLINRDRGAFLQGGALQATQPGSTTFPYVRPGNKNLLSVTRSVELKASAQEVWQAIGGFGSLWHPLVAQLTVTGEGTGQLRRIETLDGKIMIERLSERDEASKTYRYAMVSGIPANPYNGTLSVQATAAGSSVTWSVSYRPEGQGDLIVRLIISSLLNAGMAELKKRFGATT